MTENSIRRNTSYVSACNHGSSGTLGEEAQQGAGWARGGCYKQGCCQEPILRAGRKSGVEMVSMGGSLVWVDPTCESWHERLAGLLGPHPWWASSSVLLMIPDGLKQSAVLCVSASEREAVRKCLHGLFTPLCPSFWHNVVEYLSLLAPHMVPR